MELLLAPALTDQALKAMSITARNAYLDARKAAQVEAEKILRAGVRTAPGGCRMGRGRCLRGVGALHGPALLQRGSGSPRRSSDLVDQHTEGEE